MEWISVKDRLPEIDKSIVGNNAISITVIGYYPRFENMNFFSFDHSTSCWISEDDRGEIFVKEFISHWMPLPEPPKE